MTSKKRINKNFIILSIIVFFGIVLRLYSLDLLPPSLNWDEASHGYNAYSILKTGKDEWGESYPLIFRAYGDYKLPVYIYLTAISELFLGVNPIAVRLPSAVAGVILIVFTYLIAKSLTNSEKTGIIAGLLVAIEPWSLFLSRVAVEANVAVVLVTAGVYFLLTGLEKKSYKLVLGIFLMGLSVWTYNSARIFVPLLLLALTLIYKTEFLKIAVSKKKLTTVYLLVAVLIFLPMFYQLINPAGQARFEKITIIDEGAINEIVTARNSSPLPDFAAKAIHNKGAYFLGTFFKNYISYFSLDFLYLSGGDHYQFNVQEHGLLYIAGLPFLLIGIFKTFQKKKLILIVWLLLAPIAASATRESPHTLRSIVMLPMPMILSAYGFSAVSEKFKKYQVHMVVFSALVLGLGLVNYLNRYTKDYKVEYSQSWQYGYKEVVAYVKENYFKYDTILFTKYYGEPHEFVLFFWPWEPNSYRNDPNLVRFHQSDWYWVDAFDKFYFFNDWEVPNSNENWVLESGIKVSMEGNSLLIARPGNYPNDWSKIKTIYFLDGSSAFDILEKGKSQ